MRTKKYDGIIAERTASESNGDEQRTTAGRIAASGGDVAAKAAADGSATSNRERDMERVLGDCGLA